MSFAEARVHKRKAGSENHALGYLFACGANAWLVPLSDRAQLAEVAAVTAGEIIDWHDLAILLLRDPLRY